jgi:hypothetical protein
MRPVVGPTPLRTLAAAAFTVWTCAHAPPASAFQLPASAFWFIDGDVNFVYETNVGLAQTARDVKSDGAFSVAASPGIGLPVGDSHLFSLAADLGGSAYVEQPGLSNVTPGATTAYRTKFGLGPYAPWLRLFASGARLHYDDPVRNGWRYRLGLGGGMRFGERWNVRLDYFFEERFADHEQRAAAALPGDVFDTVAHTYGVRVDFVFNEVLTLFSGYAVRDGDVVSTTRRNPEIFQASDAVTPDPAFGRDFFAYRVDAIVHMLTFGLSFAVTPHASLNFSYERHLGLGRNGMDYENDIFRAGILVSY